MPPVPITPQCNGPIITPRSLSLDTGANYRYPLRPFARPGAPAGRARGVGSTFIKLGQLLSTRSDLVTERYQSELGKLRDHVQPIPRSAVRDQIEQSLGRPVSELYAAFDWAPLASASIGQVHAAVLPGGGGAVVKVLRPGIRPRSRGRSRPARLVGPRVGVRSSTAALRPGRARPALWGHAPLRAGLRRRGGQRTTHRPRPGRKGRSRDARNRRCPFRLLGVDDGPDRGGFVE